MAAQTIEEARAVYDALLREGAVKGSVRTVGHAYALMDAWDDVIAAFAAARGDEFWILFEGGPGPVGGTFVEVEDDRGNSIGTKAEWKERPNGMWTLGPFLDSLATAKAPLP